jgi:chorismate lyase/3-hydroxybenzoate synthase
VNTISRNNSLLDIQYQQRETLSDALSDPYTLAIIDFADQSQLPDDKRIIIGTPALAGGDLLEVWRTDELPESGMLGDVHYRRTSTLIFGQVLVANDNDSIESITQNIYQQINRLQQEFGYPQMIRVWNYLSSINRHDDGMERYQSFCVGRHQAIDTSSGFESHLPAATAVGTHDDNVLVYFIAAREAFSRAMVKQWGGSKHLYISGTASILGHETRHKYKLLEQLDECLNNMDILITEANKQADIGIQDVSDLTGIKLYLRQQEDLEAVISHLRKRAGNKVHVAVLHADICRDDLLLEIEGFWVE